MAKITISRIFETSKTLATEPGRILQDFIAYMVDVAEQALRALRNGLTFTDNFDCLKNTYTLSHNVEQVIDTGGRVPSGVLALRVVSNTYGVESLGWYVGTDNLLRVKIGMTGAPSAAQSVVLLILFG